MVIRAKFQEYVARFVQLASQYEEQTDGQTSIGLSRTNTPESAKYLGTGLVFTDESSRSREISANASRIEGWRATTSYTYLQEVSKNTRKENMPSVVQLFEHDLILLRGFD
jgi:hypothetical protein